MKRWAGFLLLVFSGGVLLLATSLFSGQRALFKAPVARGDIYDFESRLLATSKSVRGLFLDPRAFGPTEENIKYLARIAGWNPKDLRLRLVQAKVPFLLKEGLSPRQEEAVAHIPGVFVLEYFRRQYPFAQVTRSFLGRVSPSGRGIQGIEASYDAFLQGRHSFLRTAIDLDLQEKLNRDLRKALKIFHAREGAAAVMSLCSGRLVALAATNAADPLLSDTLSLRLLAKPLEKAFSQSQYPDKETFLRALGFGSATHIDLPAEKVGLVPLNVDNWSEVQATPLQMLRALVGLATGRLYEPKVVWEIHTEGQDYTVAQKVKPLLGLKPLRQGGIWWQGGNRRAGYFLLAGLWPRRHPRLAYVLYVKGVRVWGLPVYPSRLVPRTLWAYQAPRRHTSTKAVAQKRPCRKVMPDVRGLTLRAALERLAPLGLEVHYSGFGVTVRQWPKPGTPLKDVHECRLVLDENV